MFPRDKIASVETTEIGDRQEINGREQSLETDVCVCVCVCVCVYTHTYIERKRKKWIFIKGINSIQWGKYNFLNKW